MGVTSSLFRNLLAKPAAGQAGAPAAAAAPAVYPRASPAKATPVPPAPAAKPMGKAAARTRMRTQVQLHAATALHQGDRPNQQDQVAVWGHPHASGCVLGVVADGMGGKSGGRTASNQALLTAQQIFEAFAPARDDPEAMLLQVVKEAHALIRMTAVTADAEPHSTLAAFLVLPTLRAYAVHVGDSRVHHFRGEQLLWRSTDHSYVQRLISEGKLTPEQAESHPKANLLTRCLGMQQAPATTVQVLGELQPGDVLLACSDGLWPHVPAPEIANATQAHMPREAVQQLLDWGRARARGKGDNISIGMVRVHLGVVESPRTLGDGGVAAVSAVGVSASRQAKAG